MSPTAVNDAMFDSCSSDQENADRNRNTANTAMAGDAAPFTEDSPHFVIPTDDFILPDTNEASQLPRPSLDRQYENISFLPLRMDSQDFQATQSQGTPYFHSSKFTQRLFDFYVEVQLRLPTTIATIIWCVNALH
mmetsp:Transcript_2754/g.6625  ORF Transcript_2754/g.6625 Transcript_2754/m.6625 type:complete len:135 (+) Transcript_2754:104-508(+)